MKPVLSVLAYGLSVLVFKTYTPFSSEAIKELPTKAQRPNTKTQVTF